MKKNIILFVIFGLLYMDMEVIVRAVTGEMVGYNCIVYYSFAGWTSLYMYIIGGFCGWALGFLNQINFIRKNCNVFFQAILGSIIVTVIEFLSGTILNIIFCLRIWDYSNFHVNLLGQISLISSLYWFIINPFVFWLDDVLRFVLYKEGNIYNLAEVYYEMVNILGKPKFQNKL